MTNSKVRDVEELMPILKLTAKLSNFEARIVPEGQASIIEVRPSSNSRARIIDHDDILTIVELLKKYKNFLMYILADSSEPIIKIHRRGPIH